MWGNTEVRGGFMTAAALSPPCNSVFLSVGLCVPPLTAPAEKEEQNPRNPEEDDATGQ